MRLLIRSFNFSFFFFTVNKCILTCLVDNVIHILLLFINLHQEVHDKVCKKQETLGRHESKGV